MKMKIEIFAVLGVIGTLVSIYVLTICLVQHHIQNQKQSFVIIQNYPSKPSCWIVNSNEFFAYRGGIGVGYGYQPNYYFTGNNIAITTNDPNQIVKSFNLDPKSCRIIQ